MPEHFRTKSMSRIKEVQSENKDGSNDKRSKSLRQNRKTPTKANPPGFLDKFDGDATY